MHLIARRHTISVFVVIGNVAYKKSATQSIDPSGWGGKIPAKLAVDGNTNPSMGAGHCASPDTEWGKNAWWMVDLEDTYNISRVIIYNTDSYGPCHITLQMNHKCA